MADMETAAQANAVPESAEARLTWSAGGREIGYTARAGHVDVFDADGVLEGKMFNVAYLADTVDGERVDPRRRPVSFCFNGGPGSA